MKKVLFIIIAVVLFYGCGQEKKTQKVENIIFMIGDGMGLAQLTALSLEQDYEPLNIERAQYVGIQKTYSANNRVTDSSASGTAMATGTKTLNGYVGLDSLGQPLESTLRLAQRIGKATALIATVQPMSATPAAFYAHSTGRWDYGTIALQMLESGVDVIVGSGAHSFRNRKDLTGGIDIIDSLRAKGYAFAPDMQSFMCVEKTPAAMFFESDDFPYMSVDSLALRGDYLPKATAKTLELLGLSGKKGFFIMIEGSMIDYGGHDNNIDVVLGEMRDFDNAVKVAFDYADAHPGTLVVVTGDHETGGLSIVSPQKDYTKGEMNVDYRFSTESHSGTFIPVYSYGAGAEHFTGIMENTDLAVKMKRLLSGD